jgi:hypothetical protein
MSTKIINREIAGFFQSTILPHLRDFEEARTQNDLGKMTETALHVKTVVDFASQKAEFKSSGADLAYLRGVSESLRTVLERTPTPMTRSTSSLFPPTSGTAAPLLSASAGQLRSGARAQSAAAQQISNRADLVRTMDAFLDSNPLGSSSSAPRAQTAPAASQRVASAGIVNGGRANCWINAVLQMILSSETLMAKVFDCNDPRLTPLKEMLGNYDPNGPANDLNSGRLRTLKNEWGQVGTQHDSADLIDALFHLIGQEFKFTYDIASASREIVESREQGHSDQMARLDLDPKQSYYAFPQLLGGYLDSPHPDNPTLTYKKKFDSAPNDLTFQARRFSRDSSGRTNKLNRPIFGVMTDFALPPKHTKDGKKARYTLSTCIVHDGPSLESGHFITIKKEGDKWFKLDDSTTKEITRREAEDYLTQAYILNYTKVEQPVTAPAPRPVAPPLPPATTSSSPAVAAAALPAAPPPAYTEKHTIVNSGPPVLSTPPSPAPEASSTTALVEKLVTYLEIPKGERQTCTQMCVSTLMFTVSAVVSLAYTLFTYPYQGTASSPKKES